MNLRIYAGFVFPTVFLTSSIPSVTLKWRLISLSVASIVPIGCAKTYKKRIESKVYNMLIINYIKRTSSLSTIFTIGKIAIWSANFDRKGRGSGKIWEFVPVFHYTIVLGCYKVVFVTKITFMKNTHWAGCLKTSPAQLLQFWRRST